MKEKELRENAECRLCNEKIGKSQIPMFMTVTVKRYALKLDAIMRQQCFAMQLGNNGLIASVMGPDEDLAEIVGENTITVCEKCALHTNPYLLHEILEKKDNKKEPEEE